MVFNIGWSQPSARHLYLAPHQILQLCKWVQKGEDLDETLKVTNIIIMMSTASLATHQTEMLEMGPLSCSFLGQFGFIFMLVCSPTVLSFKSPLCVAIFCTLFLMFGHASEYFLEVGVVLSYAGVTCECIPWEEGVCGQFCTWQVERWPATTHCLCFFSSRAVTWNPSLYNYSWNISQKDYVHWDSANRYGPRGERAMSLC